VFTGLIGDVGSVAEVHSINGGLGVAITSTLAKELNPGASIAVNGVCLTAVASNGDRFEAEVVAETLRCSSLGALEVGARVNLELPLRPEGRLDGHIVQGHCDGVGVITGIRDEGASRVATVAASPVILRHLVGKGSIAVDGVALTVARLDEGSFDVALIPETLERTTFGGATMGRRVNLEADVLAKHVERLVGRAQ
jgi:riboflavin synthase